MSILSNRVKELERRSAAGDRRIVVWRPDRGEPEPEAGPDDIVIKVVSKGRSENTGEKNVLKQGLPPLQE